MRRIIIVPFIVAALIALAAVVAYSQSTIGSCFSGTVPVELQVSGRGIIGQVNFGQGLVPQIGDRFYLSSIGQPLTVTDRLFSIGSPCSITLFLE